jgi:ATP synthase protein I
MAILVPGYKDIFLGMALGTGVSCVNALYLGFKVIAVTTAISEGKTKRMGMGFITRVFFAIMAVVLATKYPVYFNLYAVVFGLVVAQFSLLVIGIYFNKKLR